LPSVSVVVGPREITGIGEGDFGVFDHEKIQELDLLLVAWFQGSTLDKIENVVVAVVVAGKSSHLGGEDRQ
jgi:hypothetical protein